MTRDCRQRWILVAIFWIAASLLALWNLDAGRGAVAGAQTRTVLAAGRQFQAAHQEELERLEQQIGTLTRSVESPSFGLLYLEQDLGDLARVNGLEDFKFDGKPLSGKGTLPVTVSFNGRLSDAAQWLAAVQERMPYLVVNGFDATGGPKAAAVSFNVSLLYRFEIKTPQA